MAEGKYKLVYSDEAEVQVIGALFMGGTKAMSQIAHLLKPDDFYRPRNEWVFAAMLDLYEDHSAIDLLTVTDRLQQVKELENVGGSAELAAYTENMATSAHLVSHAKIVTQKATLRRILGAAHDIAKLSQDESISADQLLVLADKKLKNVTQESRLQEDRLQLDDLNDYMRIARENKVPEGTIQGLSTGLYKVDKMTQGFTPGELMIISGQTSHGKTQLSNNIIYKAVEAGKKAMFVTMEMTKQQIGDRFNMLSGDKDIGEGKVLLNHRADLKSVDVTRLIEKAKERGCDLVVIDHLHYFSRSVDNATAEVSRIVKEFKEAAVQYEIPVILICHVRKMAPKKHPTLEDLRDSSLIAQDADMVLIVWRDETPDAENPNEVEVTLHKNRLRQKKHRREFLFADGMKLVENDTRTPEELERTRIAANNARMLGEKDYDEEDLLPEGDW